MNVIKGQLSNIEVEFQKKKQEEKFISQSPVRKHARKSPTTPKSPQPQQPSSKTSTLNNLLSSISNKVSSESLLMDKLSAFNKQMIDNVNALFNTFMDRVLSMLETKIDY